MKSIKNYEIISVYTNNNDHGAVLARFTNTADTIRDAMMVIGNYVDDRDTHETLSWVLREVYSDDSVSIVQTGELSDTDTKVTTNSSLIAGPVSEYYQ